MGVFEGAQKGGGVYSFATVPLGRQCARGTKELDLGAAALLGYGRLEDPELVVPISALYREVWAPWQNFFLPCLKLERKWREGSHWRKRYEPPRTAYERLCAPGILRPKQRRQLRECYESLNPFDLKDELE